MRWLGLCGLAFVCFFISSSATADEKPEGDGWIQLWDGKSFEGWKANENQDSWKIKDGKLVCHGPRSHLFYTGDLAPFKNFQLSVEVMTTPGSNSGIYFHTKYQESGWPKFGYEAQVNNSHGDPKRTASLYGVVDVLQASAKDNQWYRQEITVTGRQVIIKVDKKVLVDYTEPPSKKAGKDFTRVLEQGTFALQAHDPKSVVYFKNIRVKKLPSP